MWLLGVGFKGTNDKMKYKEVQLELAFWKKLPRQQFFYLLSSQQWQTVETQCSLYSVWLHLCG